MMYELTLCDHWSFGTPADLEQTAQEEDESVTRWTQASCAWFKVSIERMIEIEEN